MNLYNESLNIYLMEPDAIAPFYAHKGDSGLDLFAYDEVTLRPGDICAIGTRIQIGLPDNTEGQIRSKSGLALNHGISVLNSPGTIDSSYTGEIKVILKNNHRTQTYHVEKGQKIAQLVICPIIYVQPTLVIEPTVKRQTSRGDRGFGSTGI